MAIYRCEIKTISRSKGQSSTAAAAYRAGIQIQDEATGLNHDYSKKRGVEFSSIITPPKSPTWSADSNQLWNVVEKSEVRKNSTVAREFLIALPHELDKGQRQQLAHELTQNLVDRFGFAAEYSIHAPDKPEGLNHHVHILASTRKLTSNGFTDKTRELDDRKSGAVDEVREMVANTVNQHLKMAGLDITVSHKSLIDQQQDAAESGDVKKFAEVNRQPTISLGKRPETQAINGARNDQIKFHNAQRLEGFTDLLKKNVGEQISFKQPQPSNSKSSNGSKTAPVPTGGGGGGATPPASSGDFGIADIENQLGSIEIQINIAKLQPSEAAKQRLWNLMQRKEELQKKLRLAIARRAEAKSKATGGAGIGGAMSQGSSVQEQQQQKQQKEIEQQKAETEQQKRVRETQQKAKQLRQLVAQIESKAMSAKPHEKQELWDKAFKTRAMAEELERSAMEALRPSANQNPEAKKSRGAGFRPPRI